MRRSFRLKAFLEAINEFLAGEAPPCRSASHATALQEHGQGHLAAAADGAGARGESRSAMSSAPGIMKRNVSFA
jgi:hypothetical protein